MSFFSHIGRVIRHVVTRPIRSIKKVIHNPTAAILNKSVRSSAGFKKFARPVIKIGAGVALGAVTGGIGLAGFTGLSLAGAAAGGLSSIAAGGFTKRAFSPLRNVVLPAAAGAAAGAFSRLSVAQKAALNPFSTSATAGTDAAAAGTQAAASGGVTFAGAAKTALVSLATQKAAGFISGGGQQPQDQVVYQDQLPLADQSIFDQFGNNIDPYTADPNGVYFDAAGNQITSGNATSTGILNQLPDNLNSNAAKPKSQSVNTAAILTSAAAGGTVGGLTGAAIGAALAFAIGNKKSAQ